jgi:hypothetical protein
LGCWGGKATFSGGGTGDNIPVTKSKYKIYFNDLDGSYLMIPNQQCIKLIEEAILWVALFLNSKSYEKTLLLLLLFTASVFCPTTNSVMDPNPFEETTSITITMGGTVDEAAWELRIILYIYGLVL